MVTISMMSAKMTTLDLFGINVFWKKGYDVITSVHDVTNKILSGESNCCRCDHWSCDQSMVTLALPWEKL